MRIVKGMGYRVTGSYMGTGGFRGWFYRADTSTGRERACKT